MELVCSMEALSIRSRSSCLFPLGRSKTNINWSHLGSAKHSMVGKPSWLTTKIDAASSEDALIGLAEGFNLNLMEIKDNLSQFHSEIIQSIEINEITSPIPPDEEFALIAGFVLAGVYVLSPPYSLLGLADILLTPFHKIGVRQFKPEAIRLGKQLGEGSFGIVYEGYAISESGEKEHVVLKRVKSKVLAAEEMRDVELYMNHRLKRSAPNSCADFLGTMEVSEAAAHGKLHEGLWLVWKYQGEKTLSHFMKQKNFPLNVAKYITPKLSIGDTPDDHSKEKELIIIREIVRHLLNCLRGFHRTGVVHRDIKPSNIVVLESESRYPLRLIDLGACVDLRTGHNYVPNETVMDPKFAAPEKFVMPPQSTPNLPPEPFSSLISPFYWAMNTPDRFDLYSVGVILMQLCLKQLRSDTGLEAFNQELAKKGHDLDKWRKKSHFNHDDFTLLDANGGAAWELARALLQPRADAHLTVWPGLGGSRPSASAALRFRFFSPRAVTLPVKDSKQKPVESPENAPLRRSLSPATAPIPVSVVSLVWRVGALLASMNEKPSPAPAKDSTVPAPAPATALPSPLAMLMSSFLKEGEPVPASDLLMSAAVPMEDHSSSLFWQKYFFEAIENFPKFAIAATVMISLYQGFTVVEKIVTSAHEFGRSSAENSFLPMLLSASAICAILVLLAKESPPTPIKTVRKSATPSPEASTPASSSAEPTKQTASTSQTVADVFQSLKDMEAQIASIESSVFSHGFSDEKQDLVERVEALLVYPVSCPISCPWPRQDSELCVK